MFNIVLYEPEIPFNTGAAIRLCANTGASLHLIEPLGFELTDSRLRRVGLDYHEYASVRRYASLGDYLAQHGFPDLVACSTRATKNYTDYRFKRGASLLFGPETRGLPQALLDSLPSQDCLRIPMTGNGRSLNLANCIALALYEAWRQQGFAGSV